eukprot:8201310-Pyramimonas_sp.AAC.1
MARRCLMLDLELRAPARRLGAAHWRARDPGDLHGQRPRSTPAAYARLDAMEALRRLVEVL